MKSGTMHIPFSQQVSSQAQLSKENLNSIATLLCSCLEELESVWSMGALVEWLYVIEWFWWPGQGTVPWFTSNDKQIEILCWKRFNLHQVLVPDVTHVTILFVVYLSLTHNCSIWLCLLKSSISWLTVVDCSLPRAVCICCVLPLEFPKQLLLMWKLGFKQTGISRQNLRLQWFIIRCPKRHDPKHTWTKSVEMQLLSKKS